MVLPEEAHSHLMVWAVEEVSSGVAAWLFVIAFVTVVMIPQYRIPRHLDSEANYAWRDHDFCTGPLLAQV